MFVLDRHLDVILLGHALHHHHRVGIVIQIKIIETIIVTIIVTIGIVETIETTKAIDVRILVKNPMNEIGIVVKLKVFLSSYREWPHNRMTSCKW